MRLYIGFLLMLGLLSSQVCSQEASTPDEFLGSSLKLLANSVSAQEFIEFSMLPETYETTKKNDPEKYMKYLASFESKRNTLVQRILKMKNMQKQPEIVKEGATLLYQLPDRRRMTLIYSNNRWYFKN